MSGILHFIKQFWVDYGPYISLILIPTIITGLSRSPQTAGTAKLFQIIWDIIKQLLSYGSAATFKDEPGTFQVPIVAAAKREKRMMTARREKKKAEDRPMPPPPVGPGAVMALVFLMLTNQGCCAWTGTCEGKAGEIANEVVDCGKDALKDGVTSLLPTVLAILTGGAPNWSQQLDSLEGVGKDALSCAIAVAVKELQDVFMSPKASPSMENMQDRAKAETSVQKGKSYLLTRKISTTNVGE